MEKSARRLWHYAITTFVKLPKNFEKTITWSGDLGLLKEYKQGKRKRFDLAQKSSGGTKLYFGVTEDGIHGDWRQLVGIEN